MVDRDVMIEKVNGIQNCLKRIHDTVKGNLNSLNDYDVQDIVVLNLQRAVQLTIDLAAHVVAAKKLGLPQSLKDNFQLLMRDKIIDNELCKKMENMVGFRNIAVHDYRMVDPDILRSICSKHLGDLEQFYEKIMQLPG